MNRISFPTLLHVEWLKLKRSPVKWLVLGAPLLYAAMLVWYYHGRQIKPGLTYAVYQTFWEAATALLLPIAAGLLAGLIVYSEENAGQFTGLLGSGIARHRLYLAKLTLLSGLTAFCLLLATAAFSAGIGLLTDIPFSWKLYASAAGLAAVSVIPLLAIHLWMAFAWGMTASAAAGMGGLLIAALSATSLGDAVWPYLPWAWPIRFAILPGLSTLVDVQEGFMADYFNGNVTLTVSMVAVFLLICVAGSVAWFRRWEGRQ